MCLGILFPILLRGVLPRREKTSEMSPAVGVLPLYSVAQPVDQSFVGWPLPVVNHHPEVVKINERVDPI